MDSLAHSYNALVLGSTGTIGSAFVEALQADFRCAKVVSLSRPQLVLEEEASLAAAAQSLKSQGPFHLIIDATGALTIDGVGPEKRLGALDPVVMARAFQVNAIGRAMVLKHFVPLLAPKDARSIFAVLSAKVGSIADNKLGGWYSYRASKAAGNMLLQTTAVESFRTRPLAVFAALQPGTVPSKLSEPFNAGHPTIAAKDSVQGLLATLDGLPAKQGAWFVDYKGAEIPW